VDDKNINSSARFILFASINVFLDEFGFSSVLLIRNTGQHHVSVQSVKTATSAHNCQLKNDTGNGSIVEDKKW
jgi:hypothetical protein